MVIGNGFFSENRQTALAEMTERSKCEVRHLPFPTVGNITYYISYTGDLYGQPMTIEFEARLRDEQHFPSPEALKVQLALDREHAERLLSQTYPRGNYDLPPG